MQNPERSFTYESWANRHVYEHLGFLENPPERAFELLAHVLAGLAVWIARIQGQDSSGIAIWSACSLSDCATHLNAVDSAMSDVLRSLQDTPLDNEVRYTNQHGLSYATSNAISYSISLPTAPITAVKSRSPFGIPISSRSTRTTSPSSASSPDSRGSLDHTRMT